MQVSVTSAVSVVSALKVQAVEDEMPDSGSVTVQFTLTVLRYQPFLPNMPLICGVMRGGVVSVKVTPLIAVTVTLPTPLPGVNGSKVMLMPPLGTVLPYASSVS